MRVHGQELRPEDTGPYREAAAGLLWLASHEALDGVHEIIRERRRQIEVKGYTPAQDDRFAHGELFIAAKARLALLVSALADGSAGYPEHEAAVREAAAMCAAEIDRLGRMMTPEHVTIDVTPEGPA